jgi:hypothetical protein
MLLTKVAKTDMPTTQVGKSRLPRVKEAALRLRR